jgi:hypothetical protein
MAAPPAPPTCRPAARIGGRDFQVRSINPDDIKVNLERQDNLEVLEVKIELPDGQSLTPVMDDDDAGSFPRQKPGACCGAQ